MEDAEGLKQRIPARGENEQDSNRDRGADAQEKERGIFFCGFALFD